MPFGVGGGAADQDINIRINSQGGSEFTGFLDEAAGGLLSLRGAALAAGGALVAAAAGGFAASISAAREWNSALRELAKVTTVEQAQRIGEAMTDLSQEIPLATEELVEIATQAARFGVAEEHIESFVETVSKMAVATDLSVNEAGRAFAKLSQLTQTPIQEIDQLANAINELGQTTATSAGEIVDNMLRSAGALTTLGATNTEIVGLAAALNAASESSERAGTRLRRLASALQDPGTIRDIASSLIEASDAQEFFGDTASDARDKVLDERDALSDLQLQLQDLKGELEGLDDAHDELGDRMRKNRIRIKELQIKMDETGGDTSDLESRIEHLRRANEKLSLEQLKVRDSMDDLREEAEDVNTAMDEQEAKIQAATDTFVEQFGAMAKENPVQFVLKLAEAMESGGESADVLREHFDEVSTQALTQLGLNMEEARDAIKRANRAAEEGTSINEEFAIENASLGSELQRLENSLSSTAAATGNQFIPHIKEGVIALTGVVEQVRAFNDATDGMAGVAAIAATALAGIAVAAAALGTPILALVGLVSALAAIWASDWGGMRTIVIGHVTEIAAMLSEFATFLMELFRPLLETLLQLWRDWGDELGAIIAFFVDANLVILVQMLDSFLTLIKFTLQVITGDWKGAWQTIQEFTDRSMKRMIAFFERWDDELRGVFNAIIDFLTQDWLKAIEDWGRKLIKAFVEIGRAAGKAFRNAVNAAIPDQIVLPEVEIAGFTFGGDVIPLPQLAEGGLVTKPTLAMLGEGGPELVTPLDKLGGMAGVNIRSLTIHASGRGEGREAAQAFADELRSYGFDTARGGVIR